MDSSQIAIKLQLFCKTKLRSLLSQFAEALQTKQEPTFSVNIADNSHTIFHLIIVRSCHFTALLQFTE